MKVIEFLTGYIGEDNVVLYDGVIGQDIIDKLFSNAGNSYFNKLIEVMELKNIFELIKNLNFYLLQSIFINNQLKRK